MAGAAFSIILRLRRHIVVGALARPSSSIASLASQPRKFHAATSSCTRRTGRGRSFGCTLAGTRRRGKPYRSVYSSKVFPQMSAIQPTHSSHWGGFTVQVEDGDVVAVQPLHDPDPSPLLGNLPGSVRHAARVRQPVA